ncbi:MAG: extracellular solute-binding protein [Candidatus Hydrogenedentota bacterium]|nr:MAG: extracellular solute-binding protein [Candidatus Hydrogenedentota bacterium]
MRTTLRLFLFFAALLCFPDQGLAEEAIPKIELRLWHQWRAGKQEILESIVENFGRQHETIKVLPEPLGPMAGTVAERMLLGPTAASLPELALVEREAIPTLAGAGLIRPFDEFIGSSGRLQKENLLNGALAYGAYNGKVYGVPAYLNPYVLIYNPELLRAAGVSFRPRDWDDFIRLARGLSGNKSGGDRIKRWALSVRSMASLFHILCFQKGIDLYGAYERPEHAVAIKEVLNFVSGLRRTYSLLPPHYKSWDPNFLGVASGKVFFQIDDAATLADLLKRPAVPVSVTMVPCDSTPFRTCLSASEVFVVSAFSGNDGAILEFLEFFYSPESYSRFAERLFFVSPLKRTAAPIANVPSDGPLYSQLVSAAGSAGVYPLRPRSGTMLSGIDRAVERLDAGLISPERALQDVLEATERGDTRLMSSHLPVRITWAESTRRLHANEFSRFRAAPVEIISARNEHETFQLALSAEHPMDELTMSVGPFISEDGESHEFKTVAYLEKDTVISLPLVARRAGPYPNLLKQQAEFSITPGALTRIWVDTFVPDGVTAGKYSGTVRIQHQGANVAQVPVRLRVLPLRIPTAPSRPAVVGLNYELIAKHYGLKKNSQAYRMLMDSFFWFLVEHRLSPYLPPVPIDSREAARYVKDERVSGCRLPFHPNHPRFERAVLLAKQGGWLEKLFAYFIDEPTYHQYGAVIKSGERIHSMSASPKFLVTCFPDELLIGAVDIWCIHMRFLPEGLPHGFMDRQDYARAVSERLEAGDEVWWYTAGGVKPFPTLHIEDDPAAFRIIPWLPQLYRIGGFLHWQAANWSQPFDKPFVPPFGNGEGVLVYPGDSQPASSIRLELLREGLEDMEYLLLLGRNIGDLQKRLGAEWVGDAASARVREMCRRLISDEALRAHALNGSLLLPHFVREPGSIERVREEVADETISLETRPFALVLTEPEERQYTDLAYARIYGAVEPQCKVEVNDLELAVDEAGSFSVRLPLSSGTNNFLVRLEKEHHSRVIVRKIEKF